MFAALGIDSKATMGELPIICDFPEVFWDYISDLSPECKVEFAIDLVPGTSFVSMDPYRMYDSQMSKIKK